ncbi:MAG TPA: hypothetical protein VGG64_20405 [Pirellulales bacterium]
MSRISSCASCHGDFLIPGASQPKDQMRCPLCNAQFLVQDVLAGSIFAPPEAIPVAPSGASLRASAGARQPRPAEPVDFDAETIDVQPPQRRKQPGIFAHLIGIVGGGILGLSLGYLGLLRFGGPQYDFLHIGNKLPPWVTAPLPRLFPGKDDAGLEPPRHERGLEDLLNQPDQPPTVDLQPAGGPTPFDTAPPFSPAPGSTSAPVSSTAPFSAPPFSAAPPDASIMPSPQTVPPADAYPVPMNEAPLPQAQPGAPPSAEAPANPPPPQGVRLGPRQFSAYSAEDLALAVNEVSAAWRCSVCNGTGQGARPVVTGVREAGGPKVQQAADHRAPCDACGGKPIAKMTPDLYAKLCHLAEVVTFVSKGDTSAWSQRETVQGLLATAGADQKAAEAIGRLAGFQLEPGHHKDPGIALAGTVQEMSQVGSLFGMKIVLFGLPKVVTVVSWRPAQPAINVHDRVIILGSIVENPTENLVGYEGRQPQVIWGGLPAKLSAQP